MEKEAKRREKRWWLCVNCDGGREKKGDVGKRGEYVCNFTITRGENSNSSRANV